MRNTVSTCLMGTGILLLVIGFFTGIVIGADHDGFHIVTALYWWLSGITAGFVFIALSEIVNLLQKLVDKTTAEQSFQTVTPPQTINLSRTPLDIGEKETSIEESTAKIKDLTILIDDVRFKGLFLITDTAVRVMKKSMFQADSEAVLMKEISKISLSADYERDKDYVVFHFIEGGAKHKLAFKTFNVYDYDRIINLLKQGKSR